VGPSFIDLFCVSAFRQNIIVAASAACVRARAVTEWITSRTLLFCTLGPWCTPDINRTGFHTPAKALEKL